ncbi:MAG: DUF3192 domain-containing protein [Candidatus Aceula meridiana]|nr:DUF3192 domain-containing protein [Candidatus Aceula meridiana]
MRKIILAIIFVLLASSALFAQGYNDHRDSVNLVRQRIDRIWTGKTEPEIKRILGEPDKTEVYENKKGRIVKVLYYLIDDSHTCLTKKMDECFIPLILENAQLIGKGSESLEITKQRYNLEKAFE